MNKPDSPVINRYVIVGICLVLALMVWGVFGRALWYDFVNYDDDSYVYENPLVMGGLTWTGIAHAFTHPGYSFYHPLTTLSHMLDFQIYGLNPMGYHATNLLLHTLSVLLLFLILRSATGSLWRSAFVAAIFAIHPLRAESVVWVTERKDTLSGLFFMLTLAAYIYYVRRSFSWGRYGLVFFCMAAAMLSKSVLVTLPLLLLLLDYWPLRRLDAERTTLRRLLIEKIPFLILTGGLCYATIMSSSKALSSMDKILFAPRLANAALSYATYIGQTFFPIKLAVLYPHPNNVIPLWESVTAFLLIGCITGGVLYSFKRKPYLLTGWFWYLGMLVPVIGIVQAGAQAHADRYTYFPQIGLVLMLTWLVADSWASRRYRLKTLSIISATVLVTLMAMASRQTAYWRNSRTLWEHTLAHTENNLLAHYNLGCFFLLEYGEYDTAIEHFKQTLQINPDHVNTHNNLGSALAVQGKLKEALEHFQRVLQIDPDNRLAHDNVNLVKKGLTLCQQGDVFLSRKQYSEAIHCFEQLLEICPDFAGAQNNLAWILAVAPDVELRDGARAVELASKAERSAGNGNTAADLDTLAAAYAEAGRYSEAVATARRALDAAGGHEVLAADIRKRLELYQAGSPYHESEGKSPND